MHEHEDLVIDVTIPIVQMRSGAPQEAVHQLVGSSWLVTMTP